MTLIRRPGDLVTKDPASTEPWGFDWTDWLAELGGSPTPIITESTYRVSGKDAALTTEDATIVTGSLSTQVRLVGGTVGLRYTVTNRIVASSGDIDERSFKVLIQNR